MTTTNRHRAYLAHHATPLQELKARQWQEAYEGRIKAGMRPLEAGYAIKAERDERDGVSSQPPLLYELVRIVEGANQPLFIETLGEVQDIGYDNSDVKELATYCNRHGIDGYIVINTPGYGDVIEAWPGLGDLSYQARPEAARQKPDAAKPKHYTLPTPTSDKAFAHAARAAHSASPSLQLTAAGGR
jgi:hypothetical protein